MMYDDAECWSTTKNVRLMEAPQRRMWVNPYTHRSFKLHAKGHPENEQHDCHEELQLDLKGEITQSLMQCRCGSDEVSIKDS